ncbi:MAG: hypothetical protein U0521_23405 [Anaerolineae bacterium]
MPDRGELVEQPPGHRHVDHAVVDHADADALDVLQPDLDGGQVQVINRAVLEARSR